MNYPQISSYQDNLADPSEFFKSADCQSLTAVLDPRGLPYSSSGGYAAVFKMSRPDGSLVAVKCFLKDQPGRNEAYRLISQHLRLYTSPYLIRTEYREDELFVDDGDREWYPVVIMDWVEGQNLSDYIKSHLADPLALNVLAWRFCQMAQWLLTQPIAHGDIKPDNIIVKPDGSLVLVDYDGMYVPAMKGQTAREEGSNDYRHPARSGKDFDPASDDFSLALIAMSLKAIALDPSLFRDHDGSAGLLLGERDFRNLARSEPFAQLQSLLYDHDFASLYGVFLLAYGLTPLNETLFRNVLLHLPKAAPTPSPAAKKRLPETRTFTVGGVSFTMCLVEHGSFMMGATPEQGSDAYNDEHPMHNVTISRDYYLGQTQVTQALWQAVMGNNPSYFEGNTDCPVENVSWDDCQKFIKKLNSQVSGGTFSLPTEAEWEFAARGGNKSKHYKYAGSNDLDQVAWWYNNSGSETHPVAHKKPNELGLYDMSGNVYEWCADWYGNYPSAAVTDPTGPQQGDFRVLRGGCFCSSDARGLRVSYRNWSYPVIRYCSCGFRLLFRPSVP